MPPEAVNGSVAAAFTVPGFGEIASSVYTVTVAWLVDAASSRTCTTVVPAVAGAVKTPVDGTMDPNPETML
jgi:hypothetical protein